MPVCFLCRCKVWISLRSTRYETPNSALTCIYVHEIILFIGHVVNVGAGLGYVSNYARINYFEIIRVARIAITLITHCYWPNTDISPTTPWGGSNGGKQRFSWRTSCEKWSAGRLNGKGRRKTLRADRGWCVLDIITALIIIKSYEMVMYGRGLVVGCAEVAYYFQAFI